MGDLDKLLADAGHMEIQVGGLTLEESARLQGGLEAERDRLTAGTEKYDFVVKVIDALLASL